MDTLGSLARLNHHVLARQTLVGGKYELLQCTTTTPNCEFEPQPDFWVALLWKRLMGTSVLAAPRVDSKQPERFPWKAALRCHAHYTTTNSSKDGSVTLAFSNMSPSLSFSVPIPPQLGRTRVEYILQGHKDGMHSNKLELNGSVLHVGNSVEVPALNGRRVVNGNIAMLLQPGTLGFLVFPHANAVACRDVDENTVVLQER